MSERRLAAILVLDVVGYSALVGADEPGTLARLRALRSDVVDPLIAAHGGRIFKTTGDGLLAEFPSAVGALGCAIAIQQRQRDAADALALRIGLHQGEVVVDGDDLLGDGVNIAARIEPLAEPGGIAMSARVREDAAGKIAFEAEDLGVPPLKNIARPVRVFRLRIATPAARPAPPGERPALVVLPFRGGGPADEPFTDGLTEELTNALAAWRSFPVIARNSAFAYRGADVDVRVVGRDLGVRYVLTGVVRRAGAQLRLTVELADVETADILLAEHFAYDAADLMALQDEIVRAVAGILAPEVQKLERERGLRRASADAGAYGLFTRGMWHRYRDTREDLARAEALFRAALEIDPHYARATAALSLCRNYAAISRWDPDYYGAHAESLVLARRAVADDPRDPHAQFALGVAFMNHRRMAEAIATLGEAVRLNPSHAFARANLGQVFNYLNRPADGLVEIETALRLNPHDPRRYMWLPYLAASHYLAGRYRACLEAAEQALQANPGYPLAVRYLVAALGQLGLPAEAAAVLPVLRRVDRDLAGLETLTRELFVPPAAEHLLDGFRKAGFD
jgi:adenylate cyclase